MTIKNLCNIHKYGYCKLKEDCKNYHSTEVCGNKNCGISRCKRRHPRTCKYFESGYCKFKGSCSSDLLDRIIKLEKQNKIIGDINEEQENAIFNLIELN